MGKVYVDLSMSIDGYIAGANVSVDNGLGDGGEALHEWMFTGKTDDEARAYEEQFFAATGALVMGRTMFDVGHGPWGANPTFHAPVFVVTHDPHEPIEMEGGTTYVFVTDGLDAAFAEARLAAGDRDICVSGGANVVQQCLAARYVDELRLHIVPVLLGDGARLFDSIGVPPPRLAKLAVTDAVGVTHFTFRVTGPQAVG